MESQSLIQNVALSGLSSASSVGLLDDLIKEYLLFRGFNSSLKAFEYELKTDKEKSFRPDKITDMLLSYIHQYDLASLLDLWTFLDQKYFARISLKIGSSHAISRKYELFLMRYYLVHAVQTNKTEKALEFFENYVAKIQSQNEWKEWFCLPFTKNPQDSAQFSIYFNKNWIDTFMISLQNFLAIVFHSLQMPRLLNYQEEDAFWSKYLKSSSSSTDFDSFEQDYLQSELNDEFEFKNQDLTSKPSGGLIGLIKNLKSTKQNRNKEVKNLSLIANELLNDESNIESSFEKLVVNCDNVGEESSNDIENQPYVTVNQEDLTEHKSSIVMIKISYDLKYFASVDLDGMIKVWSIVSPIGCLLSTVSKSFVQTIEWDKTNSNILYIGTMQNTLKVYDLGIKKIVQELVLNKQYSLIKLVYSISNNKLVVVQLRDIDKSSQVVLYELSKNLNQLKSTLFDYFQINSCVEFVQDQLILACSDGFVRLFDSHRQEIIVAQRCHNEPILNIKINQTNSLLLTATHDQIYIWNIEDQFELDFSSKIDNISNDENFLSLEPNKSILFVLDRTGCCLINLKRPHSRINDEYLLDNSVAFNQQSSSQMSILALANKSGLIRVFRLLNKF